MEETKRQKQVGKLIQVEMSDIFQREGVSMSGGGMISVSKVSVTPDLMEARIYLSFFQIKDSVEAIRDIKSRTGEWRKLLGNRVKNQLRRVPELQFFIDDTLDYVFKMEQIFKKIEDERDNKPEGGNKPFMNLPFRIALRYLRGRGSANAVPILSRISMLAIAVGSAAMIILFSVFNGFEGLVQDLYKAFYPDIRISPSSGKFFAPSPILIDSISRIKGVDIAAPVLEDNAMASNEDENKVVTLKGVDNRYFTVNNLKPFVQFGADTLISETLPRLSTAIIGIEIAGRLGLTPNNDFSKVYLSYPNTKIGNLTLNPTEAIQTLVLRTGGIFRVQSEFDDQYILAPLKDVQTLLGEEGKISAIELKLSQKADPDKVKAVIQRISGPGMKTETRYEQNRTLYGVMRTEKWATYAILVFILLIASVNMIGALALLILEKGKDAAILTAMGASRRSIRRIFLLEGILWAAIGGGIGIIIGGLVCLAQKQWGFVTLEKDAFLIKAYPVDMQWMDFVIVFITVLVVGLLASIYPALKAGKRPSDGGLSTGMR